MAQVLPGNTDGQVSVTTPAQESFCWAIANGQSAVDAWRKSFPERVERMESGRSIYSRAYELRQKVGWRITQIRAQIARERDRLGHESIASKLELEQYATRALRTPLAEMGRDSDLLQEIVTTTRVDKDGGETVKETVKSVNKLGALGELAKLAGHYAAQKLDVGGNLQVSGLFASVAMASGGDTVVECDIPDYSALLD